MTERIYSAAEDRAALYIVQATGIGAGDDPVGFLIASHAAMRRMLADARDMMRGVARQLTEAAK